VPLLSNGAAGHDPDRGSNWFVVSGRLTDSGAPLLNNDPHLAFGAPPIWYQIQLNVRKKNRTLLNVTGVSLAGVPGVVLGHNDNLAWAATTTNFDVTDVYQEQLDIQFGSISTIHNGQREPVVFRDETFRANQITTGRNDNVVTVPTSASVPARFPSVPRRNNGPIVSLDLNAQTALSVQYVGTGATFEIETFLDFNRAKSVDEFKKALEFFDVGSQNFAVATTSGDIAYFTTGEVPLREDLEAGRVNGAPPFFIRNGMGGNEWMAVRTRQSNQNLNFELLPIAEMPQTQNPSRGFIVTANNDPVGTTANNQPLERKRATGGIYYLSNEYASGARAARLTRDIQATIASGKKITVEDARRFQASVKMRDAEILLPSILQAFDNARRNGAPADLATLATDPGITQAVTRFRSWDFSTPTGLRIGYDSFVPFNQADPTTAQINASVSATIYSVWRSQIVRDVLDVPLRSRQISDLPPSSMAVAALRNLLDNFATRKGTGASGVTFFRASELASASPEDQRDFLILRSLRRTLDELAGPTYAAAFQNSSDQNTYRWGILHRVSFPNTIGGEFSIPSTSGNFRSPFPGLFGIPRDGGFDVPNASGHDVRAQGVNAFTFRSGPSKRSTFVLKPGAIEFVTAIPGGQSGNLQSRFHDNLLNQWLTADVYPVRSLTTATTVAGATQQTWLPAKKQSKLK
jgi:penicillin amidase